MSPPNSPAGHENPWETEESRSRRWQWLLERLAAEPDSPLIEVEPGLYIIRKDCPAAGLYP